MGIGLIGAYHGEGVAQEDEARRVVGKIIADFLEGLVNDLVFILTDLVCLLVNHVWRVGELGHAMAKRQRGWRGQGDIHTNNSLRIFGPRSSQSELAEVILGLPGEGVQPRFGRLSM